MFVSKIVEVEMIKFVVERFVEGDCEVEMICVEIV